MQDSKDRTTVVLSCTCEDPGHLLVVTRWHKGEYLDPEITISMQPSLYVGVWKRLKFAVRYLFGLKTDCNVWDVSVLSDNDVELLAEELWQYQEERKQERERLGPPETEA